MHSSADRSSVTRTTVVSVTRALLPCAATAVALALAAPEAMAQRRSAAAPRTAWGSPALSGLWGNDSLTPLKLKRPGGLAGREFYTDDERRELSRGAAQRWVDAFFPELERTINGEFDEEVWMEPGS